MNRSFAISGAKLSSLFEILNKYGINKKPFLDSLNIEESLFDMNERKLSVGQVKDVLEQAVFLTGDKDIGLHIGQQSRFLPNIVCYIMMNCLTLGDALKKYRQYKRVFSDETNVQLIVNTGTVSLDMNSTAQELSSLRSFSDYKVSTMYIFLKFLSKEKFDLTGVKVKHDKPDNVSEYKKVFPCPVLFSQSTNSLIFTKESLNVPINYPNKDLLNYFEQYAQKTLDKIFTQESLPKKISRMLIKLIQSGNSPSVELMAMKLNMSVRKFQGLLEQEKTTYKQLLHTVKKELGEVKPNGLLKKH